MTQPFHWPFTIVNEPSTVPYYCCLLWLTKILVVMIIDAQFKEMWLTTSDLDLLIITNLTT